MHYADATDHIFHTHRPDYMISRLLWLLEKHHILSRLDPVLVDLAGSGCVSKKWLRAHPREARATGYVLIEGKLEI